MNYIERNNWLVYLCLSAMIAGTYIMFQSFFGAALPCVIFYIAAVLSGIVAGVKIFMTNTLSAIIARVIITGLLLCALVYQIKAWVAQ